MSTIVYLLSHVCYRSCCQLDYGTAQGLITGEIDPDTGTGMDKVTVYGCKYMVVENPC